VERAWACRSFRLTDLLLDRRQDLANRRIRRALDDLRPLHEGLDRASQDARDDLVHLGIPAPSFLLYPRQVLLEHRLRDAVRLTLQAPDRAIVADVVEALEEAKAQRIALSTLLPDGALDASLQARMRALSVRADPLEADALSILLDLADAAHLQISKAPLENAGLVLRERKLRPLLRKVRIDAQEKAAALIWIAVLERLNFDMTVEREAARWGDSTK
jgi:citrate lyase gamma subunit